MTREEFLERASKFQRPEDLVNVLEQFRAGLTRDELFNDPANQPALDAWEAAVFGVGYEDLIKAPVEVRICHPDRFPDFQLRLRGRAFDFEGTISTEAKLGEKYRGDKTLGPPLAERPVVLPEFDPAPISEAVRKKAAKFYGPGVHLCVHVNRAGSSANYQRIRDAVMAGGGDKFESVWILAGGWLTCAKSCADLASAPGWSKIMIQGFDQAAP